MTRARNTLLALLGGLCAALPAFAEDIAFVTAQAPINAVLVYDVETMTERARITGFGVEPSRMVANPDRSRLYLVSRVLASGGQPAQMRVHVLSASRRTILRTAVVGQATGRTLAISPDGRRLYVWKLTSPPQAISVAVLDSATLAEVGEVPLPWALCGPIAKDIAVAPDGRIVASGCADGLRVIDPDTLLPSTLPIATDLLPDLIGFSPNGQEIYLRHTSTASTQQPRLAAVHLVSGVRAEINFALPPDGPAFAGAVPVRMARVRRPSDPTGDPTIFVTYAPTMGGAPPMASARASELLPPDRRLTRLTSLGVPSATIFGASEDGRVGVFGNQRILRRVKLDTVGPEPIATDGDFIEVAPSGQSPLQLSDIILARPLLEDGFEQ
ncbi:MAG: hypothetical protein MEQ07_08785 [Aquimonas sp.]|nr:hypothetical protein [Aquimonas sp.]